MTTAAGLPGGVSQDDVAATGGHLIDQALMQFAGRDQLTGNGLRTAEGTPPNPVDAQPRSVTVVLG